MDKIKNFIEKLIAFMLSGDIAEFDENLFGLTSSTDITSLVCDDDDSIIIEEESSGNVIIKSEANKNSSIERKADRIYKKYNKEAATKRREPLVLKGDDIAAFNEIMNTYDTKDLYFYICALQRSIIKRLENGDYAKDGKGIEVSFSLFKDMLEDDNCCKKKTLTKNKRN